jgi:hypothetical protein
VERIIVTHGHADHFGLAGKIREAAGHPVECFVHAEDEWRVLSENFIHDLWSEEMDDFLAMVGMPGEIIENIKSRFSTFIFWPWSECPVKLLRTSKAAFLPSKTSAIHWMKFRPWRTRMSSSEMVFTSR